MVQWDSKVEFDLENQTQSLNSELDKNRSRYPKSYHLRISSGQIRPYVLESFVLPGPASSSLPPSISHFALSSSLLNPDAQSQITPIPTLLSPTHSCIISSSLSDYSIKTIPNTILKPIHDPPYRVLFSPSNPSKGLGLFATRPIARGELIAWERPGVIVPSLQLIQRGEGDGEGGNGEEVYEALASAFFTYDEDGNSGIEDDPIAVKQSAHTRHDEIRNMAIAPRYQEMHWLKGVLRTNAMVLDVGFKDKEKNEGVKEVYGGIFPLINRCNHSCTPNASTHFVPNTRQSGFDPNQQLLLTLTLYALRDILPGEEITKSYVDPFLQRSNRRQVLLENYGFECDCDSCCSWHDQNTNLNSESDAQREEILARLLTPTFSRWLSSPPSLPSSSLDFLLTTHTKTLTLLTNSSLHAPRLLIEEELAWACAAEGNKEGFTNWAGKVVEALKWVRELGLGSDSEFHLAQNGRENGIDYKSKGKKTKKVKKWKGKESMPPSGLEGLSTWMLYIRDPDGRVPGWGWRRQEREHMEKEILKASGYSGAAEIEEGMLDILDFGD